MNKIKQNDLSSASSDIEFIRAVNSVAEETSLGKKLELTKKVTLEDGTEVTVEGMSPENVMKVLNAHTEDTKTNINDMTISEVTTKTPGEPYFKDGEMIVNGLVRGLNDNMSDTDYAMYSGICYDININENIDSFVDYIYTNYPKGAFSEYVSTNRISSAVFLRYNFLDDVSKSGSSTLFTFSNGALQYTYTEGGVSHPINSIGFSYDNHSKEYIYLNDFIVNLFNTKAPKGFLDFYHLERYTKSGWYSLKSNGELIELDNEVVGKMYKGLYFTGASYSNEFVSNMFEYARPSNTIAMAGTSGIKYYLEGNDNLDEFYETIVSMFKDEKECDPVILKESNNLFAFQGFSNPTISITMPDGSIATSVSYWNQDFVDYYRAESDKSKFGGIGPLGNLINNNQTLENGWYAPTAMSSADKLTPTKKDLTKESVSISAFPVTKYYVKGKGLQNLPSSVPPVVTFGDWKAEVPGLYKVVKRIS